MRSEMAMQYHCEHKKRLQAVEAHPTLNGIDTLEVLDSNAPEGSPRQRTLLVYCVKPLPAFTSDNVRIEGGVRVKVKALWAFPAAAVPAEKLTPQEQACLSALANGDRVLVVRTDSRGDFSTYRLLLTMSATDPAPAEGFDPLLSEIPFTFKVECPSDFDCQPEGVCFPERLPAPRINYLAKDYAGFRRLILDRLAVVMPDWRERNPADLGVVLVEILAYVADHLSYYQDAVATEAYLGTARKRISVRRHARLLDYPMHDGCNARTWVTLEVEPGGAADGALLGSGTPLLTAVSAARGTFPPGRLADALDKGSLVFETMHEVTLHSELNEIHFHTWGEERCCLPKGSTRATLKGSAADLPLRTGDVLIFEEVVGPASGQEVDADRGHRQAVRLDRAPQERTDPLTDEPVLDISWHVEDALSFPLCLWQVVDGSGAARPVSVARGNVVLADSGLSVADQTLIPDTVPDGCRYRPRLQHANITHRSPYDHGKARLQASALASAQDPKTSLPVVTLHADGEEWTARRDLLNSDRFARDFVVEMDEAGQAHLRFGDGLQGRLPAVGSQFKVACRIGNGREGNVGADVIAHIVKAQGGISDVRNPLPARGGTEPEPMEQVRFYAPQAFREQLRAVTEADYASAAGRHPEVQKAVATLRWTGSWYTVFLTVDRKGGLPVDADFELKIRTFLEGLRLAGHDLEVEPPRFVALDIAMSVCIAPGYFWADVKRALLEVFSSVDLPNGRHGFFHPDNFTFGQPVYLSKVIAAAMEVPGIQWVDMDDRPPKLNRFRRWGERSRKELEKGMIEMDRLEIARLDNDPNAPENGKIEFFLMEGSL